MSWTFEASTASSGSVAADASHTGSFRLVNAFRDRRGLTVFNNTSSNMYLAPGTTGASSTNAMVKISAGSYYEFPQPVWTGPVQAQFDAVSSGSAMFYEFGA